MAKVFLDLEKIKHPNSGLGQFCFYLSNKIISNAKFNFIGVYIPKNSTNKFKNIPQKVCVSHHKITGIDLDKETIIWHSLHQEAVYFPKNKSIKLVLTIHDLNFLYKYRGIRRKYMLYKLQRLVNKSTAITYISEFTKHMAETHLDIPNNKLNEVIYNGVAIDNCIEATRPVWVKDSNPFLFTIGIINEKKNFHTLVNMMEFLPELKLYICGNNNSSYSDKIRHLIKNNNLSKRVFLCGEIIETDKKWLYKNCSAFVFPSKREGFGLPVVEAMSFGKPLIISNLTSLPEIGGSVASYFKSFNPKHMAELVKEAINSHTIYKSEQIKDRSNIFDWDIAANKYIDLYKKLT